MPYSRESSQIRHLRKHAAGVGSRNPSWQGAPQVGQAIATLSLTVYPFNPTLRSCAREPHFISCCLCSSYGGVAVRRSPITT